MASPVVSLHGCSSHPTTESPRDPTKIWTALEHLRARCLAPGGTLVVSLPLGYNPEADKVAHDKVLFTKRYFLKRVSLFNTWRQVREEDARSTKYDEPWDFGNAIFVGIYEDRLAPTDGSR